MFYSQKVNVEVYSELMEQIKKVNADWIVLRKSRQFRIGLVICEVTRCIKHFKIGALGNVIIKWIRGTLSKNVIGIKLQNSDYKPKPRYFSNEKIAIYTAILGSYDNIIEPYCVPDNCDFYIFTDQQYDNAKSVWKRIDIPKKLNSMSNAQKNRYLKMHPQEMFKDYRYSIYVDGNIQIITDLTEYINLLGSTGIGMHMHDARSCIFEEIKAIKRTRRDTKENIERHLKYLKHTNMPLNYGLLQCSVIAREHNNPICISIMNDWWEEYLNYSKRDQISFPHVLYMHNIEASEVAVMGNNIYKNPSFRVIGHN